MLVKLQTSKKLIEKSGLFAYNKLVCILDIVP